MNTSIYPWQRVLWNKVQGMRSRLPHALLLYGRQGVGKLAFAQALAHALLCETPDVDGHACGTCLSCGWLAQGNHPDYRLVEPEDRSESENEDEAGATKARKKSKFIVIDQIRALNDLVGLSTHRHGLRIVVLQPAETLNPNAANALLKILEEPPPATLFILVSHQLQRLLPTIRSRCHKLAMPAPTPQQSEAWLSDQGLADAKAALAYTGGAPLSAMDAIAEQAEVETFIRQLAHGAALDAFASAADWSRDEFGVALSALQKWCYDLLASRMTSQVRYYPDWVSSLQALGKSVDLRLLLDFQRKLIEARAQATHSLNTELQLEALLMRYSQLFPGPARA